MSCGCFDVACESYAKLGVDVKKAMASLDKIAISMHCWQGDDVAGFESAEALSGGIQVTGHHPGKARNAEELRKDIDMALSLIPGCHRINLHAIYAESNGKKVDRDALDISHFQSWVDWAKARGLKLDFNPTYFSHPKAKGDLTLSSSDEEVRKFWIAHGQACRRIAAEFGKQLGSAAVCNQWIPDGSKDTPADRLAPRQRLIDSLDQVFAEDFSNELLVDAVECKLFGIGSESYVVGSHEFYMGYAMKNNKAVCLDAGHFHPTEKIADKISALLCFSNEVLLHVSRGVRWDSDHVIVLNDDLLDIAGEIVRHNFQDRVHIGLDYFDGSINRIAAWVIGMRNMQKALLMALLEPTAKLREFELNGDFASRLALMEEMRTMPFSAVWNQYCAMHNVPGGFQWMDQVNAYDRDVLSCRN